MKKTIRTLTHVLAALLAVALLTMATAFAAPGVSAVRNTSTLYLNDRRVSVTGYNIEGNNYFMLRDLAWVLKDSGNCFDVVWNAEANRVEVLTQRSYSQDKPESSGGWWVTAVQAVPTKAQLTVDGTAVQAAAYNINGNNYYRLRDLGAALGFDVYWLEESRSICLYTVDEHTHMADGTPAAARPITAASSTARWSHLLKSYLYEDGGDVFYVLEADPSGVKDAVAVDTYDRESFALLGTCTVPMELETFGGFFAGEKYNFMVFGQDNTEENDQKEVIRVVKYDKNFQRLGAVSIKGGESYTSIPFDAGSLRMAENGDQLVIHTARQRLRTEDGLNHQSQLTICVNTSEMRVTNDLGRYQGNHVSHSFNQFVIFDGSQLVLADHGDAYPRSIVLNRTSGGSSTASFTETSVLNIPGATGANCTGVTLGGLAASSNSYLTAVNTIDHSKVTAYDSFNMTGLGRDERDAVLLVTPKSGSAAQQVRLTDYIGKGLLASTPYLVKLEENRFLVLWEEFAYQGDSTQATDRGARCVEVDGSGRLLGETQSLPNVRLSADCQPILLDGAVTWYINTMAGRMFYQIEV